jgi:hypothetical protein
VSVRCVFVRRVRVSARVSSVVGLRVCPWDSSVASVRVCPWDSNGTLIKLRRVSVKDVLSLRGTFELLTSVSRSSMIPSSSSSDPAPLVGLTRGTDSAYPARLIDGRGGDRNKLVIALLSVERVCATGQLSSCTHTRARTLVASKLLNHVHERWQLASTLPYARTPRSCHFPAGPRVDVLASVPFKSNLSGR